MVKSKTTAKKHNTRASTKGSNEKIVNDNASVIETDAKNSHRSENNLSKVNSITDDKLSKKAVNKKMIYSKNQSEQNDEKTKKKCQEALSNISKCSNYEEIGKWFVKSFPQIVNNIDLSIDEGFTNNVDFKSCKESEKRRSFENDWGHISINDSISESSIVSQNNVERVIQWIDWNEVELKRNIAENQNVNNQIDVNPQLNADRIDQSVAQNDVEQERNFAENQNVNNQIDVDPQLNADRVDQSVAQNDVEQERQDRSICRSNLAENQNFNNQIDVDPQLNADRVDQSVAQNDVEQERNLAENQNFNNQIDVDPQLNADRV